MINKYKIAIVAVFVSLICGLTHLVGFYYQRWNYSLYPAEVSLFSREEAYNYMVRTKQILENGGVPHDSQLLEYQKFPSPFISETVPAYIMAGLALVAGNLQAGFIVADFILPALLFIFAYFFIKKISGSPPTAIISGLCLVLVRDLFVYLPYPMPMLKFLFGKPEYINDLPITRSYHPQLSVLIYIVFIIFLYRAMIMKTFRKKDILFAGFFLGLLFYTYIFHWTTALFGLGIFFILNFRNQRIRRTILMIILMGLIIAIPYFIGMQSYKMLPFSQDLYLRSTGHRFEFPLPEARRFIILSTLLLIVFRKNIFSSLMNSFILTGSLLPDLSYLLLGRDLEGIHFIWVAVLPLTAIYYPTEVVRRLRLKIPYKLKMGLAMITIFALLYYGTKIQIYSALKFARQQRFRQSQKELISFLSKLPKESVVASLWRGTVFREVNSDVLLLTDNFIYVPFSPLTIAPSKEIIERQLVALSFVKDRESILAQDAWPILMNTYTFLNARDIRGSYLLYKKQLGGEMDNIDKYCHKYQLNYVVISRRQKIRKNCSQAKRIFSNADYQIYKITK